jgi:Ca2+-binding EF-hand superfamily protein
MFCINEDYTLLGQDLVLLIKSSIYGIFRLCKIEIPNDDEIRNLLYHHFPSVLNDDFFELDYDEFYEWMSKNDEVQSFLMEFFEIQTRYNAMKAYIKFLSEFEAIFDSNVIHEDQFNLGKNKNIKRKSIIEAVSNDLFSKDEIISPDDNTYCYVDKIFTQIGNILFKIDPKVKNIFIDLIDPDRTNKARKDKYMKAIKAICLFMSVDKDMSHSLSKSEMGTLMWLLTGEEPNDNNLNTTIERLDTNGDSAIELNEWLDFLSTRDRKGRRVLNYVLKQKFDLYDEDGNGSISVNELEKMIVDSFTEILSQTSGDTKIMMESIVRDLAKNIMQKMDFNHSNNLDVII